MRMQSARHIVFPPFALDTVDERLRRDNQVLSLRRKTFALLHYLVLHSEQLVTKDELLNALWPEAYVSEGALTECMRELRKVLGDKPKAPQFIATVHGRGYRFIGHISRQPSVVSRQQEDLRNPSSALSVQPLASSFVGREAELAQLQGWLAKAEAGERQIVFVTGEPGIGKTSLVEVFLGQVAAEAELWIGRGQCIEHYGAGEAYLPVLEALGRLCCEPGGARLVELLGQHAPTWLGSV